MDTDAHGLDGHKRTSRTQKVGRVSPPRAAWTAPAPAPTAAKAGGTDPLQGWKARSCDAVVKDGIVTMTGKGAAPFLGVGAGVSGPATVKFRARSAAGGAGKIEWLPAATAAADATSLPFTLAPGDWQEITVSIPATGPLGMLRLYLPAQTQPVAVDWVELKAGEQLQRWEF